MKNNLLLFFTLFFFGCHAQEKRLQEAILNYMREDTVNKIEQFKILNIKKLTEQEFLWLEVEETRSVFILCEKTVSKVKIELDDLIHERNLYREGTHMYHELNAKVEEKKKELAKEEGYKRERSTELDRLTKLAMSADNTKDYGYIVNTSFEWFRAGEDQEIDTMPFLVTNDLKVNMHIPIPN